MSADISMLAVYDKVSSVDTKVEALIARVDERLNHGAEQLDDHEKRIRSLESSRDQGRGRTSIVTILLSFLGSGSLATVISYLLTRH